MDYKKLSIILVIVLGITISSFALLLSTHQQQSSIFEDVEKITMVKTIKSEFDPMIGHESHQITLLLPPKERTMYSGILTFSASTPVKVIILQEYDDAVKDASENTLQGIIDGKKYAMAILLLGPDATETRTGSIPFTGSGLELHSVNNTAFTVNVSIDGWERKLNN